MGEFPQLIPEFTTMPMSHHGEQSSSLFEPQAPSLEFNWRMLAVKPAPLCPGKAANPCPLVKVGGKLSVPALCLLTLGTRLRTHCRFQKSAKSSPLFAGPPNAPWPPASK